MAGELGVRLVRDDSIEPVSTRRESRGGGGGIRLARWGVRGVLGGGALILHDRSRTFTHYVALRG